MASPVQESELEKDIANGQSEDMCSVELEQVS